MRILGNVVLILAMGLLAAGCSGVAETLTVQSTPRSGTEEPVTLQYRVARDALAPSKFVGVVGDGITLGLSLVWELPLPESDEKKVAQQREKERFYRLIEMLEARQINGVEFECTGKLNRFVLHATSVPRLTGRGLRQIELAGALTSLMLVLSVDVAQAHAQDRFSILKAVAADIETLKADFPQLRDFSATTHLRAEPPSISYAFRTHSPGKTGGWTSGVPSPDADGVWLHIDLHAPSSNQQLHTQPVTVPLCLGESRVSFLMLEGRDTRSLYGPIWSALTKQGARECVMAF